jgi:NADPH:quinone reductase-like Zn-dependent oxidoreductase
MKAITRQRYGTADVLTLSDVVLPEIAKDELLVRVRAASINRADWFMLTGTPYMLRLMSGLRRPRNPVPGRDVAGTVEAVGTGVTGFRPGDEVYAEITGGSLAEYARVPQALAALKPGNLTFELAATVPLAGNTALHAMRDVGRVQPGQRVLVNGASGGVGTFAVQIAKALGAEVTGVCSTRNVELVRSLGADPIDYAAADFTTSGQRYDLILDLVGNHSLSALRRALTPRGMLLLSSGNGGRVLGPAGRMIRALAMSALVRQRLVALTVKPGAHLDSLTALIEAGQVTPVVERAYPLAEAAGAFRHYAESGPRSKIVITV